MSNVDKVISPLLSALKKILLSIGASDKKSFKETNGFESELLRNFFIYIKRLDMDNILSDKFPYRPIGDYYAVAAATPHFRYPVDVLEVIHYLADGIVLKHRDLEIYLIRYDDGHNASTDTISLVIKNAIKTNPDLLKMIEEFPGDKNVTKRDSK